MDIISLCFSLSFLPKFMEVILDFSGSSEWTQQSCLLLKGSTSISEVKDFRKLWFFDDNKKGPSYWKIYLLDGRSLRQMAFLMLNVVEQCYIFNICFINIILTLNVLQFHNAIIFNPYQLNHLTMT